MVNVVVGVLIAIALGGVILFSLRYLSRKRRDSLEGHSVRPVALAKSERQPPPADNDVLRKQSDQSFAPQKEELLELNEDALVEANASARARPPIPSALAPGTPASKRPSPSGYLPSGTTGSNVVEALRKGLARARSQEGVWGRISGLLLNHRTVDESLLEPLEEVLLSSDVGVRGTQRIITSLRERFLGKEATSEELWSALQDESFKILDLPVTSSHSTAGPHVVLLVGVNGAGKTTTIGKLATKLQTEGKSVLLAAGDTFRAAAVQQLEAWGRRVGCNVVKGREGADPASVVFEAVQQATASNVDVVLVDTAGRLQTKSPLMDELRKIAKTLGKAVAGAPHETWIVIDATTGQNGLSQAKEFFSTLPLSGVILTKLDGTAKGGIALSICDELSLPVRYVGLGERADDLHEFRPKEFVEALFGESKRKDAA